MRLAPAVWGLRAPLSSLLLALVLGFPAAIDAATPKAEAAYQFALAKMLSNEGKLREATTAFERALELDPAAAYVRLEYAESMARWARFYPNREARLTALRKAAEMVAEVSRELGENLDALRVQAAVNVELYNEDGRNAAAGDAAVAALEAVNRLDPGDPRQLFTLAQFYMSRGRPREAAEAFSEVARISPSYEPVYGLLAQALIESGQSEAAIKPLRRVLEGDPRAETARLALSEILAEKGDHAGAVELLRAAPGGLRNRTAQTRLATELYLLGDLTAALTTLDSLPASGTSILDDTRYVAMLRGLVLSALGRNGDALGALQPLLADGAPPDANVALTVAQVLVREGRGRDAVNTLRDHVARLEAQASPPEAARGKLALARLHAQLGEWAQALEVGRAVASAPDRDLRLSVALLSADALVELGRGDEALTALDPAAVGSSDPRLTTKRLEVQARIGRAAEAVVVLDRLVQQGDRDGAVAAAEALHRAQRYDLTLEPLSTLVAGHPDLTSPRFLLGAAYERLGRHAEAEGAFRALLAVAPDFHQALNYLGYMWVEQGQNLNEALGMIQQALTLDPGNGSYLDSLGWAYYRLGRYPEARDQLLRAASLSRDATVYEHLGDTYVALGDPIKARDAYERARTLDPDDAAALERKLAALAPGAP